VGAKIVGTVGYVGGSEVPVFTKTYSLDGTGAFSAESPLPGDVAAVVRYSTADRSTKNHPIYCFNYYHAVTNSAFGAAADNLNPAQLTALQTYANHWITGFSDGATTVNRSRPSGDLCTAAIVNPLLTHRDLAR